MEEATNVGSVYIKLEIESSLEEQIDKISSKIAGNLKSNLESSLGKNDMSKMIDRSFSGFAKRSSGIGAKIGQKITDSIRDKLKKSEKDVSDSISRATEKASISAQPGRVGKSGVTKEQLQDRVIHNDNLAENLQKEISIERRKLDEILAKRIAETKRNIASVEEIVNNPVGYTPEYVEEAKRVLDTLKERLTNMNFGEAFGEEAVKVERKIILLNGKLEALVANSANLEQEINNFDLDNFGNQSDKASSALGRAGQAAKNAGRSFKQMGKDGNSSSNSLVNLRSVGKSLMRQFLGIQLLIRMAGQAVRRLAQNFFESLKANEQFSASLQQIKSNMSTAFQPIYQAILPAINFLMNAIAKASAYIATFVSLLFGSTVKAANAGAKALNKAKKAVESYGAAQRKVAGFDMLNDITEESSGGGSVSTPAEILPVNLDEKEVGKVTAFFNKIKPILDIISEAFNWVSEQITGAFEKISGNKFAMDFLVGALGGIALAFLALKLAVAWAPILIAAIIIAIAALINNWEAITQKMKEVWEKVWNSIKSFFSGIWQWLIEKIDNIKQWFNNLGASIGDAMQRAWGKVKEAWFNVGAWFKERIDGVKQWFENLKESISQALSNAWNSVSTTWTNVKQWFSDKVVAPVANLFVGMWDGLKNGAGKAWEGIKSTFSTVATFFKDTFTKAWTAVKDIFSVGGKIFDGIKEGIITAFTNIVNAIIRGINKVVSIPFNGINTALSKLRDINLPIIGKPFGFLSTLSVPKIPELAKGSVLTKPTLNIAGEYPGANANPEIVSPKSIMADTFREVLSEFITAFKEGLGLGGVNQGSINLVVNIGGTKLLEAFIDLAKEYSMQTGKQVIING